MKLTLVYEQYEKYIEVPDDATLSVLRREATLFAVTKKKRSTPKKYRDSTLELARITFEFRAPLVLCRPLLATHMNKKSFVDPKMEDNPTYLHSSLTFRNVLLGDNFLGYYGIKNGSKVHITLHTCSQYRYDQIMKPTTQSQTKKTTKSPTCSKGTVNRSSKSFFFTGPVKVDGHLYQIKEVTSVPGLHYTPVVHRNPMKN